MSSNSEQVDCYDKIPSIDFSDPNNRHDRVLVVEGNKFYVISELLSNRSEFFNAMLNGEFKEKTQYEIEIKDVAAVDFKNFLKFCYSVIVDFNKDNYANFLQLASRFLAEKAIEKCSDFILKEYSSLDKIDLLEVAIKHNLIDVKDKLSSYFGSSQTSITIEKCDKCGKDCYIRCQRVRFSWKYIRAPGYILNEYSDVYKNKDRVLTLSPEAKGFILDAILRNN